MPSPIPLINGISYGWADVSIVIAGFVVTGVTAINYSDAVEKTDIYGVGRYPVERFEGKYSATVSVTFLGSQLEALIERSPTGRLQDFGVFDIIVNFLVGTSTRTHIIRNVEFKGNSRNMTQNTPTSFTVAPPMICSHIQWKAGSDNSL